MDLMSHKADLIVLMGTSGSGKSSVGVELSSKLRSIFLDADDFHSKENKLKMSKGIPLTDSDRFPWLTHVRDHILLLISQFSEFPFEVVNGELKPNGKRVVLACSALKPIYRQILSGETTVADGIFEASSSQEIPIYSAVFVLLTSSPATLMNRLKSRENHFVNESLLESQLETLEADFSSEKNLIKIDTENKSILEVVAEIVKVVGA